jgi:glyoxylase-like metal-dependent hydrolase (beta-lactamase superfamily II)
MPLPTIHVGSVSITSLTDGTISTSRGFFGYMPDDEWAAEAGVRDPDGGFTLNFGSFLIREGDDATLVDTGNGTRPGSYGGALLADLRRVGVAPDEIRRIVITHLHGDHVGGSTEDVDGKPRLVFPNARHVVQRKDWDALDALSVSFPNVRLCIEPVHEAGLLDLVDGDVTITPAISGWLTPGHTPGHQCVIVSSGNERAIITGDLMHMLGQLNHPGWKPTADMDKDQAVASRTAVLERLDAEGLTLCAGHFPYPGIGNVVRLEGRRTWRGVRLS